MRVPQNEQRQSANAFTLIELLVVIAILGVLMGLLLPAVQSSREAARRAQCSNNLKQMGLAFTTHHDHYGFFPSGGWDWFYPPTIINGAPAISPSQRAGWGYQILPFLEARNTWNGGLSKTDQERILIAIGTPNSVFFCPSRRDPSALAYSDPDYLNGMTTTQALCDYAGSNYEGTGIVQRFQGCRIRDVRDGLSNTFIVAEKRLNLSRLGSLQSDDDIGYTSGWDQDTIRSTSRPPAHDYLGGNNSNATGDLRFGSSHPGSFNALFGDGSVRAIRYSIDPGVFQALGNKADRQIISSSAF